MASDKKEKGTTVRNCGPEMKLLTPISGQDYLNGRSNVIEFESGRQQREEAGPEDSEDDLYLDDDGRFEEEEIYDGTPLKDLSPNFKDIYSDGLIKKRIKRAGLESFGVVPERGTVTINYSLFLDGDVNPFDSTFARGRPERFNLSSCSLLLGIQSAIMTMKKTEISEFIINFSLAYGIMGCAPRIPPRADIFAVISVEDFVTETDVEALLCLDPDLRNMENGFDKIHKLASTLLQEGNEYVQKKEWRLAGKKYQNGSRLLEEVEMADEAQESAKTKLILKLYLNLGYAYIKSLMPQRACIALQKALDIDEQNEKGNFRMGLAKRMVGNHTESLIFLKKALKLCPGDKTIGRELSSLEEEIKANLENEKVFCQKMLGLDIQRDRNLAESLSEDYIEDLKQRLDSFVLSDEENMYLPQGSKEALFLTVKDLGGLRNLEVSKLERPRKLIKISKKLN